LRVQVAPAEIDADPQATRLAFVGPLLDDPQPDGAGFDLGAEIDVPIDIPGLRIDHAQSAVTVGDVAAALFVGGNLFPTVTGGSIDLAGGRAGVDVDLGETAVDFLDRQTANRLRLVPLQ